MKAISILLLIVFLSSCNNFPTIRPLERCITLVKGSIGQSKCRCHMYDLMDSRRVSDSYDKDLGYCSKLVGFNLDDWGEINDWIFKVKQWGEDKKADH